MPPYCSAVCGVMPNCAHTGMPARVIARTASGNADGAIELHEIGAAFFDQAIAARTAVSGPFLQRAEGKVAAHQRTRGAASDGAAGQDHLRRA